MDTPRTTADMERKHTDAGSFADKVAAPDPAAAPLGTDDEASGQPAGSDLRPAPGAGSQRDAINPGGIRAGDPPTGREWRIVLPIGLLFVILILVGLSVV